MVSTPPRIMASTWLFHGLVYQLSYQDNGQSNQERVTEISFCG